MGEMIEFARPDGSRCAGYLAAAGTGKPAVIIIQEWWGLNPQICGVADRFAAAGFTALAPDLYHGRVTQDPDEASHLMNGLDFPGATHQDLRAAGQKPEIYRYAAAHAFCNEQRPEVYDPACAKLAMQRTLDFFSRTLA